MLKLWGSRCYCEDWPGIAYSREYEEKAAKELRQCLLHKHEHLNLDLPSKTSRRVLYICNPRTGTQRLEDLQGLLTIQMSLINELQAK